MIRVKVRLRAGVGVRVGARATSNHAELVVRWSGPDTGGEWTVAGDGASGQQFSYPRWKRHGDAAGYGTGCLRRCGSLRAEIYDSQEVKY